MKVSKKVETGVTTLQTKEALRAQMKEALKKIDAEFKKLDYNSTQPWKAGSNFKMNENDSNNINITTCVDVCYLLKALTLMLRLKKEYNEVAESMNLVKYPVCAWLGYSVDLWVEDLKKRITQVTNADTIAKLTTARNKLEAFLSEEDRLATTLIEISSLFKIS